MNLDSVVRSIKNSDQRRAHAVSAWKGLRVMSKFHFSFLKIEV